MANEPIAIVGMAGLFPNAHDVHTYWHNILNNVPGIIDPPSNNWDTHIRGGYLGDLARFNPKKFGVKARALDGTEPAQWLALATAQAALDDANFDSFGTAELRAKTAVIIGNGAYINRGNTTHYQTGTLVDETVDLIDRLELGLEAEQLSALREELQGHLPAVNARTAQGLIPNIIAGRVANHLDLMGGAYTVDAACASALFAVEQAIRGLQRGEIDCAIVGGAYVASPGPMATLFGELGIVAANGTIEPFGSGKGGTLLGEGVAMLVLRRLSDAAPKSVYAVIRGVGTGSDGGGINVLAPKYQGAVQAMKKALADAAVEKDSIDLIESHGLGTKIGDHTEFAALATVYGGEKPRTIGTVKAMTGHTMPASGANAIIKAALAIQSATLPPTLNVANPDPALDWAKANFSFLQDSAEWSSPVRRAAVNSYGFGGVAAHLILENAPSDMQRETLPQPLPLDEEAIVLETNRRTLVVSDSFVEKLREAGRAGQHVASNALPVERDATHDNFESFASGDLPPARESATQQQAARIDDVQIDEQTRSYEEGARATSNLPLAPSPQEDAMNTVMSDYFDLMQTFLQVQRDVMLAAMGGEMPPMMAQPQTIYEIPQQPSTPPAQTAPTYEAYSPPTDVGYAKNGSNGQAKHPNGQQIAPVETVVEVATVAPPPPAPAKQSGGGADTMRHALVEIVAEQTGYPADMIGTDLDLEAELGIDSIKRVEILTAFQEQFGDAVRSDQMDDLSELKTLDEIVAFVGGDSANFNLGGADAPDFDFPYIRNIVTQTANRVEALNLIDVQSEILLRDHAFGRGISTDPAIVGLPVLPMTGAIEMMAEAAQLLEPTRKLIGLRDVRSLRWITAPRGMLETRTVAEQTEDGVKVRLFVAGERSHSAEMRCLFDLDYPSLLLPPAKTKETDTMHPQWQDVYAESGLFHGEGLQNIRKIESFSDGHINATLEIKPNEHWLLDPILLDGLAQLSGCWGSLTQDALVLPVAIEALDFAGPLDLAAGEVVHCESQMSMENGLAVTNLHLFAQNSSLLTATEWRGQPFALPKPLSDFLLTRQSNWLGDWKNEIVKIERNQFPLPVFSKAGGVWTDALAFAIMHPSERNAYQTVTLPPALRLQTILQMIAAKEWLRRNGADGLSADIPLTKTKYGFCFREFCVDVAVSAEMITARKVEKTH